MRVRMRETSVLLITFVCLAHPLGAETSSTRNEFWPEFDAFVNLNDTSRLSFLYSAIRENDLNTYAEGEVGVHFDYYARPIFRAKVLDHPDAARDKLLMFRIGYLYSRSPGTGGSSSAEHIPTIAMTVRATLPWGINLSERNRGDLKFAKGLFTPTYRNRLQLEKSLRTGRIGLIPYASAEAFYDTRYDKFNQFRYTAGMEWILARFLVIKSYFSRQRTTTSSPEFVNGLGITVQFYLRQKTR
jgi:hypothetical protein